MAGMTKPPCVEAATAAGVAALRIGADVPNLSHAVREAISFTDDEKS
jgi:hypothetical protein